MGTPEEVSRSVARAVAESLSAAGIPQRDAADQTGIPLATLSRRLTGKSPMLVTELAALCDLLGVSVPEMVASVRVLDQPLTNAAEITDRAVS